MECEDAAEDSRRDLEGKNKKGKPLWTEGRRKMKLTGQKDMPEKIESNPGGAALFCDCQTI